MFGIKVPFAIGTEVTCPEWNGRTARIVKYEVYRQFGKGYDKLMARMDRKLPKARDGITLYLDSWPVDFLRAVDQYRFC